jgi:YidC/Oxa1 family membrane protein insertase
MIVQMPVLLALYDAIHQSQALKNGQFLFFQLGSPDHTFILPILAALFTFASSWLATKANPTQMAGPTKYIPYIFPFFILLAAINVPSALSLYWVVSNAFQAIQTYILQNPFKAAEERQDIERREKDRQKALRKALNRAHKRS